MVSSQCMFEARRLVIGASSQMSQKGIFPLSERTFLFFLLLAFTYSFRNQVIQDLRPRTIFAFLSSSWSTVKGHQRAAYCAILSQSEQEEPNSWRSNPIYMSCPNISQLLRAFLLQFDDTFVRFDLQCGGQTPFICQASTFPCSQSISYKDYNAISIHFYKTDALEQTRPDFTGL